MKHPVIKLELSLKYNNTILHRNININIADRLEDVLYLNLTINNLFTKLFKLSNCNTFYICNNKLITGNYTLYNLLFENDTDIDIDKCINSLASTSTTTLTTSYNIECFNTMRGGIGIGAIVDMILMPVEFILEPIFGPIAAIGQIFIFLIQLIVWFVKFVIWFIFFVTWLFTELLNPVKLVTDFCNSMLLIIVSIVSIIFNTIVAIIAYITNSIGGWTAGFWGWDQSSLTKNDKNSNYFKKIDRVKGKKCFLTNTNTVPFSILLGTILCPPIGVFMNLGLTGWFNILICILLTLLYYLPGLFYALLVIYA